MIEKNGYLNLKKKQKLWTSSFPRVDKFKLTDSTNSPQLQIREIFVELQHQEWKSKENVVIPL